MKLHIRPMSLRRYMLCRHHHTSSGQPGKQYLSAFTGAWTWRRDSAATWSSPAEALYMARLHLPRSAEVFVSAPGLSPEAADRAKRHEKLLAPGLMPRLGQCVPV